MADQYLSRRHVFATALWCVMIVAACAPAPAPRATGSNNTSPAAAKISNATAPKADPAGDPAVHIQQTVIVEGSTITAAQTYVRRFPNMAARDGYLVGAYFYPWYGPGRRHWQDGYARHPLLGEYDSSNPEVIRRQIDWASGHGIDFFVVSWWGPESAEDAVLRDGLLGSDLADDMRFAIIYESAGRLAVRNDRIDLDDPANRRQLKSDFAHLWTNVFTSSRYLKVGDRPVVVLYLSRIFMGDVAGAISELQQEARRNGHDLFLIADEVYWGSPSADAARLRVFDAVTSYNMHTSVAGIAEDFTAKVKAQYEAWALAAQRAGIGFVPDVIPGFDDHFVRPEARHPPIGRSVDLFTQQLDMVLPLVDPSLKMLLITSWNEWHEDTSIEAAQEFGFEYLDVLRRSLQDRW
jgi:hypothetical protein